MGDRGGKGTGTGHINGSGSPNADTIFDPVHGTGGETGTVGGGSGSGQGGTIGTTNGQTNNGSSNVPVADVIDDVQASEEPTVVLQRSRRAAYIVNPERYERDQAELSALRRAVLRPVHRLQVGRPESFPTGSDALCVVSVASPCRNTAPVARDHRPAEARRAVRHRPGND